MSSRLWTSLPHPSVPGWERGGERAELYNSTTGRWWETGPHHRKEVGMPISVSFRLLAAMEEAAFPQAHGLAGQHVSLLLGCESGGPNEQWLTPLTP